MIEDNYRTRQTLLIRLHNQNDQKAWEEFIEVYQRFIYHILNRMQVHANDLDDLVQDVLLRLWKKLASYDPKKAKFRSWLSFVIRNTVLNDINKNKIRHQKLNQFSEDSKLSKQPVTEIDLLIEHEWKRHISNLAMTRVSTLFSGKAIDVFKYSLEGDSNEEISLKLNIKPDSVKVLKSRVKSRYMHEVKRLIHDFEEF